jgi:hypothetical protein
VDGPEGKRGEVVADKGKRKITGGREKEERKRGKRWACVIGRRVCVCVCVRVWIIEGRDNEKRRKINMK